MEPGAEIRRDLEQAQARIDEAMERGRISRSDGLRSREAIREWFASRGVERVLAPASTEMLWAHYRRSILIEGRTGF
ncbi:MAG TPA: hypothetical protein VJ689_02645 [Gaiellaceae bacterium]|nr:hypothetical protein [Gaiellaceae bacterium]